MSIESATFVVQRGDDLFSCLGSELAVKLQDGDLMVLQDGDTHYKWEVGGSSAKSTEK